MSTKDNGLKRSVTGLLIAQQEMEQDCPGGR